MGITPISSSGSQQPFPSNDPIIDELQQEIQSYEDYMHEYMDKGDHSPETTKNLQDAAAKLLAFINQNKNYIEQVCKNNGWPATNTVGSGYDDCIQGVQNCEQLITQGSNIQDGPLYMLNEDVSGLISMMTQHHSPGF